MRPGMGSTGFHYKSNLASDSSARRTQYTVVKRDVRVLHCLRPESTTTGTGSRSGTRLGVHDRRGYMPGVARVFPHGRWPLGTRPGRCSGRP